MASKRESWLSLLPADPRPALLASEEPFARFVAMWVVGKSKGKGFSSALLDACVADAKRQTMKGVAMVTSERVWLAGRRILDKHGFECVDTAPPAFSLMVRKLGKPPSPSFAGEWEEKAKSFGKGLTVIRSDQCPYIVDATNTAVAAAAKAGVRSQIIELQSREDVMRLSPSAYSVFGLVLDGRLVSYHYLLEKDLLPLLTGETGGQKPRVTKKGQHR